jgi:hypothetical protein
VALLTPDLHVGDANDHAAHRPSLHLPLDEPEEDDRARHVGPRLEPHLAGEHCGGHAPDPAGGRQEPVGLHRHVQAQGNRAAARHGARGHHAAAHLRAAVEERRAVRAVPERGRVRVAHAHHEEERDVELDGDGRLRDDAGEDARGVHGEELGDRVSRAEHHEHDDGGRGGEEEQDEDGERDAEQNAAESAALVSVVLAVVLAGRRVAGIRHGWSLSTRGVREVWRHGESFRAIYMHSIHDHLFPGRHI